jgi:hypothetical protein
MQLCGVCGHVNIHFLTLFISYMILLHVTLNKAKKRELICFDTSCKMFFALWFLTFRGFRGNKKNLVDQQRLSFLIMVSFYIPMHYVS